MNWPKLPLYVPFSVRDASVVQRLTTEVQQHSEQKYISIHCPANETWSLWGKNVRRGNSEMRFLLRFSYIFFFPPTTNRAATQHFTALLEQIYKNALADSSLQNVLSALNFTNYNSTASVRATCSLWSVWCWILSDGTRGWIGRRVCCRFGRTVWSIYMCSSTLILFTIYKVNTYSTSTNLHDSVGSPITDCKWDGQREKGERVGHPGSVCSFKRRQQKKWLPVTSLWT